MHSEAPTECSIEGNVVRVQRQLLDSPPPATFSDVWQDKTIIEAQFQKDDPAHRWLREQLHTCASGLRDAKAG